MQQGGQPAPGTSAGRARNLDSLSLVHKDLPSCLLPVYKGVAQPKPDSLAVPLLDTTVVGAT